MKTLTALPMFVTACVCAQTSITNPLPPVQSSGSEIWVRDFATIPYSARSRPYARINEMKPFSAANGWLGVNDLRGELHMLDVRGISQLYLNVATLISAFRDSPGLGTGLTSFAAHPDYDSNGIFYTSHTEAAGSGTPSLATPLSASSLLQGVILEWTAADPTAIPFVGTRRELMRIDFNGNIHGFQQIDFRPGIDRGHPDFGKLFICMGDAQTMQRGPLGNIGTIFSPLGSLMRIDPLATNSPHGRYGIPGDNPFVNVPGAVHEIWAYGFRNPHRIAWNNEADQLLVVDIGERNIEELNIVIPSGNYGWPYREGPYRFDPTGNHEVVYPLPADDSGYIYPVAMYDHDDGNAIGGGIVYRGSRHPALAGFYMATDVRIGKLFKVDASLLQFGEVTPFKEWFLRNDSGRINPYDMVGTTSRTDMRIGYDFNGELYILTKQDGQIRKLVHPDEPAGGYGILEGYPWNDFWINTGDFLGWMQVSNYPWSYSLKLGKYLFINPADTDSGWVFIPRN